MFVYFDGVSGKRQTYICMTPSNTHNIRHMILYMIKLEYAAKFVVDSLVKCIHFRIYWLKFLQDRLLSPFFSKPSHYHLMTLINNNVRATFFPIKTVPYYKLFEKKIVLKRKKKPEKAKNLHYMYHCSNKKKKSGHTWWTVALALFNFDQITDRWIKFYY